MSLRQVYFATLDLALHSEYQPGKGGSVFKSDIVKRVVQENTVLPPLPEDRFLNSFQHIFAGGYSAGETARPCITYAQNLQIQLNFAAMCADVCRTVGGRQCAECCDLCTACYWEMEPVTAVHNI